MSKAARMVMVLFMFPYLAVVLLACGGVTQPAPEPPAPVVSVLVSPAGANLPSGATLQLNATVETSTDQHVTWQVNGVTAPGGAD